MFRVIIFFAVISCIGCRTNDTTSLNEHADTTYYQEAHRPQLHFSPAANWMNDPNGLVYFKSEYHLFYQHYPEGDVWGPMHWGHAISKDLVHWEHLPIALYPDSIGMIFSGSAVVDVNNTSGFGSIDNPPLVAIFTYHNMQMEKAGAVDYQTQGIAYSTDAGRTWVKYPDNPVLKNPGIKDFRDPKVFWYEPAKKWIMTLAVKDHIELYGSDDLKDWNKLSEFGKEYGGHGGVWECPDLIELSVDGSAETKWVLLLSINPGGPNGGSATQYFVGTFDGKNFKCDSAPSRNVWVDYGPDNYAGVTWANIPNGRKVFLGWMSNWDYAQAVPTAPWRSAMTLPRDLSLQKIGNEYFVKSSLSDEVTAFAGKPVFISEQTLSKDFSVSDKVEFPIHLSVVEGVAEANDFTLVFSNDLNEELTVGFRQSEKRFHIDRSKSGNIGFSKGFSTMAFAPRVATSDSVKFTIVSDVSSVEVFFDDGLTVMTAIFFPGKPYSDLRINPGKENFKIRKLSVRPVSPIWQQKP